MEHYSILGISQILVLIKVTGTFYLKMPLTKYCWLEVKQSRVWEIFILETGKQIFDMSTWDPIWIYSSVEFWSNTNKDIEKSQIFDE